MLTGLQRETIFSIVSLFETGRLPTPDAYGTASVLADGAGITAGVHQATAHSGSLREVVRAYYAAGGVLGAEPLHRPPRQGWSLELVEDVLASSVGMAPGQETQRVRALVALLQAAGGEPRMMAAQDLVFARDYWDPAVAYARAIGLVLPLSWLALYDLAIQSGPRRVDNLRATFRELPPSRGGAEIAWTTALCRARRAWLAGHPTPIVRRSVYRVDALLALAAERRWMLDRPLTVRGQVIDNPDTMEIP